MIRRYQSLIVFTDRNGRPIKERELHKHFTKTSAWNYSRSLAYDPKVIQRTLNTIVKDYPIFCDPGVRDLKTGELETEHL